MQKRAGILFLSSQTHRILLIHDNLKWTVPTFVQHNNLIDDAQDLIAKIKGSAGKIIPIELYLSEDRGFEYSTYICLVEDEFLTTAARTICWTDLNDLPKNLHSGLKTTLNNNLIRGKIDTILVMSNGYDNSNIKK